MILEQNKNEQIDTGNDRLESLMAQTPSLNNQSSEYAITDNNSIIINENIETESSSSSSFMNSGEINIDTESSTTDSEELDESLEIESDKETEDDDKTVCDDESEVVDNDPIYKLLSQDHMNVHLDNELKSAVRKFLKARFCKYFKNKKKNKKKFFFFALINL
jgi:hypothetical protein